MNDVSAVKTPPVLTPEAAARKAKKEKNDKIFWHIVSWVVPAVWLYLIVQLFIFDIDARLASWMGPGLLSIFQYKLMLLAVVVLVAMAVLRNLAPIFALAYVAIYPFVFLFWKFPKFVWMQHNWLLGFAILNALSAFFRSLRRSVVCAAIFLLSATLILAIDYSYVLYGASGAIFVVTAQAYVFAFIKALNPAAAFEAYTKDLPLLTTDGWVKAETSEMRALPEDAMTKEQLTTRNEEMQSVLLYNRACLLISKKLRGYRDSGANIASYLISFATLLVFTILSFALINDALYKTDHTLYRFTSGSDSLATFFNYSAGSLIYLTHGLVPSAPLSQGVHFVELVFGILLITLLVTTIFFLRSRKYLAQLEEVIVILKQLGEAAGEQILREYHQPSIEVATEALAKSEKTMPGLVRHLTKEIERQ
jgi:hypothetical protein